jgi:tetratricopeptide (TPR) repeat protein
MARINLEYMDEVDLAEDYLNEAFQLNPDSQSALELRGQIFARRGNWRGLLDVKAQQLERLESEEERIAMHLERADILVEQLDAPGEAVDVMQEILAVNPTHEEALQRSRSLYEQTGNLHGVYGLLDRRVEHAEDEESEIEFLMEMAQLADEELETPQLVVDALERAYQLRPEDLDVAEPLIDAYLEAGRVEDAEPILEELIARLEEEGKTDEAVRFQHQRGKLAEEKGDLEAAQEAYEAVFKLNDTYIPNLLSLGKLAYEREDWEKAKNTFQKLLLHQMKLESDDQKVDVYYYLGLIRKRTGDDRRAKDMFNRALSINSKHEPSREELESL